MEKNNNGRLVLTVLIIISTIFLSSAVALYFMRQSEIEKRVALEKKLEELMGEKVKLAKTLDETTAIKNDLETKFGNLEEKARLLEVQLESEKKSRETIYSQLENEKKESRKLVDDLMRVKEEKEQVSLTLADTKSQCEVLKVQIYSIQQAKEALENKLKEMMTKSEVELEKIVVKPENTAAPQDNNAEITAAANAKKVENNSPSVEVSREIKGEVLVVNKKFDFVVISLGETDGMKPGTNLAVYRNGKFLTMLQVEKVHPNMSAAKIPPQAKSIDIKEGDEVIVVK